MHAPNLSLIPVELLLRAYRGGVFPMADHRDDPEVYWVEPRERAIIPIGGFHCSRSLARTIRRDVFTITVDSDFAGTIVECAAPRADAEDTWISGRIAASYQRLHEVGHAHSIECRQNGELVGGVYGVAFDRVFCGESMFSRRTDASKVALGWLLALLERAVTLSPRAVEVAKTMIHAAQGEDRAAMVEALGSAAIAATDDRAEGVAAFRDKRTPDFSGK